MQAWGDDSSHNPSSSHIIWAADANYRIDLDNDAVRRFALADELDSLLARDQVRQTFFKTENTITNYLQLKQAMDNGSTFQGYEEGPVLFRPTYRYDLYSDNYDTSEKGRTPAWTGKQQLPTFFLYPAKWL